MQGSRDESSEPSSFAIEDSFSSFTRSDPLHDSISSTPGTSFSPDVNPHPTIGLAAQPTYLSEGQDVEIADEGHNLLVDESDAEGKVPSGIKVDLNDPPSIPRTSAGKQLRILEEVIDVTPGPWLSSDHDLTTPKLASTDTTTPGQGVSLDPRCSQTSRAPGDKVSGSAKEDETGRAPAAAVRLSFNSSGGASLLAGSETTPSPPRSYKTAPTPFATRQSLRRSYSAAGLSDFRTSVRSVSSTPGLSTSSQNGRLYEPLKTAPIPQRENAGRVRDSRTWEFWCDSSARNELAEHAKMESDGNARHAIGLLRSRSSLGSRNAGKGTPSLSRANSSRTEVSQHDTKRYKLAAKKDENEETRPKPHRGQSTAEHKRSKPKQIQGLGIFEDTSATPASPERLLHSPAGDSDKENHGPESLRRHHSQLKGKPQRRRPALTESHTAPPFHRARSALGSIVTNRQPSVGVNDGISNEASNAGVENMDPEADEELARFMRSGKNTDDKPSGSGDVDELAVQGLLSLSQGNWR